MTKMFLILIIIFSIVSIIFLFFSLKKKSNIYGVICALAGISVIALAICSLFNASPENEDYKKPGSYVSVTTYEESITSQEQRSLRPSQTQASTTTFSDKSESMPDASAAPTKGNHSIVYITKSGKKYHYSHPCGRGTFYECPISEALSRGLEPCKKCVK